MPTVAQVEKIFSTRNETIFSLPCSQAPAYPQSSVYVTLPT